MYDELLSSSEIAKLARLEGSVPTINCLQVNSDTSNIRDTQIGQIMPFLNASLALFVYLEVMLFPFENNLPDSTDLLQI